jgi:hypothetical protein
VFDANQRLEALPEPFEVGQAHAVNNDAADNAQGWINKPAVQALADEQPFSSAPAHGWTQLLPQHLESQTFNTADAQAPVSLPPIEAIPPAPRKRRLLNDLSDSTAIISSENHGQVVHLIDADTSVDESAESLGVRPASVDAQSMERRKRRREKKQAALQAQGLLEVKPKRASAQSAVIDRSSTAVAALMTLCVLLGVVMILQLVLAARYVIVDNVPFSKPLLAKLCEPLHCRVEPAVWLSPLNLDALSLSKLNTNAGINAVLTPYRMQATVRNTSHLTIQTPDIELAISDAQGRLLARRMIPAKLVGGQTTLPANSDWQIDSTLLLDPQTIGYTARLVYSP